LTDPLIATAVQGVALWLWHAPALFDLALEHEGWHIAQHLSFLVSALFFWSAMFQRRSSPGVAAACLFVTSLVGGALGAFMAVSVSPWYAPYAALGMTPIGLTPAEDQQMAGLIMWIPGGLFHAVFALAFVGSLLRDRREAGHAHP
jgi:cytochrome c oxidase assembly factor CtaG